jgi:hypothetical protein
MRTPLRGGTVARGLALTLMLTLVLLVPAAAAEKEQGASPKLLEQISTSVATHYYAAHPDTVPFGPALARLATSEKGKRQRACTSRANNDVFNCDFVGLPQNEESITACPTNSAYVLGGTNDYRGLLDPEGNFTGWHWSTDGGKSVTNEGLLPPVRLLSDPNHEVPSGGDPVDFIQAPCAFTYAASLAYDPVDPFGNANGVAAYRSTPAILSSCPGGSDPSCWPVRRLVVESDANHFLDKEWMFVGVQGGITYVWLVYSDFDLLPANPAHPFEASLKAVRCDANLVTCTAPIPISTVDDDVQFGDVTVGPDGRAYITWSRIEGELEGTDQTFVHKIRVETAPGSAVFGPEHVVYREDRAIPFGGFLQANDFRIATYPKSDVAQVAGHTRTFVVWDACKVRLLGTICEFPEIKLSYSDDAGVNWTGPFVISRNGGNYFPTISVDRADPANSKLSIAWFTNRFDSSFWNAQDVVLTEIEVSNATFGPGGGKRITRAQSNEPEADPLLGGFFIGDYIEVTQVNERAWVHYNANYRQIQLLFEGLPVNQQDNYLKATDVD